MAAGFRFQFRPILTVCVVLALGVLFALGNWQLQRLEWKRALVVKIEARVSADPIAIDDVLDRVAAGEDMEYAPVRVSGVYGAAGEAKVFGTLDGAPGYYLFSPLMRIEAAASFDPVVYINRGFVPQSVGAAQMRVDADGRALSVSGLFRQAEILTPPASWFRSTQKGGDGFWFVRDPVRFAAADNIPAGAYYIDSFAVDGTQWPKGGTTRLNFRNSHLEYALTWFGLAGALFAVWVAMSVKSASVKAARTISARSA